jgi:hypothetical protein
MTVASRIPPKPFSTGSERLISSFARFLCAVVLLFVGGYMLWSAQRLAQIQGWPPSGTDTKCWQGGSHLVESSRGNAILKTRPGCYEVPVFQNPDDPHERVARPEPAGFGLAAFCTTGVAAIVAAFYLSWRRLWRIWQTARHGR